MWSCRKGVDAERERCKILQGEEIGPGQAIRKRKGSKGSGLGLKVVSVEAESA